MNPLTAKGQIQGAAIQGIGMAPHEDLIHDRRTGQRACCVALLLGARLGWRASP